MKEEGEHGHDFRMQRWKMREEMLNSMSEKELRAFIKGYMISEHTLLRHLNRRHCQCGSCSERGSQCGGGSCSCGNEECKGCK